MDAIVLSAGIKRKSLTEEWETKSRANKWEAMGIRNLSSSYVQLRCDEIGGKKDPETVASELKKITAELTNLMMSNALNPAQRLAVLEEVEKVSFEEFFTFRMQENPDFNQTKVKIAQETVSMDSVEAKNVLELPVKPLPEKALTLKPR